MCFLWLCVFVSRESDHLWRRSRYLGFRWWRWGQVSSVFFQMKCACIEWFVQTSEICSGCVTVFCVWPTCVIGVLLLSEGWGVWEGGAVRSVSVSLHPHPQTLWLNQNELTFSPFDSFRPSQKLQSVPPGFTAHHQICSIVSHFPFSSFLSSCLAFSVCTHQKIYSHYLFSKAF